MFFINFFLNIRKLRLCVEATGTKETEDACGVALSRTLHTYSSNEAHEEKDADAGEDVSVHAPLDLAAFVPRATVVQHGFRLMAFEGKGRSSVFGPRLPLDLPAGELRLCRAGTECRRRERTCGHRKGLGGVVG